MAQKKTTRSRKTAKTGAKKSAGRVAKSGRGKRLAEEYEGSADVASNGSQSLVIVE